MNASSSHDVQQIEQADATGRRPVVFVHGWQQVAETALAFVRRFA